MSRDLVKEAAARRTAREQTKREQEERARLKRETEREIQVIADMRFFREGADA